MTNLTLTLWHFEWWKIWSEAKAAKRVNIFAIFKWFFFCVWCKHISAYWTLSFWRFDDTYLGNIWKTKNTYTYYTKKCFHSKFVFYIFIWSGDAASANAVCLLAQSFYLLRQLDYGVAARFRFGMSIQIK